VGPDSRPGDRATYTECQMSEVTRKYWFWRFMLVLGLAFGADFLVDLKYWLVLLAILWVLAAMLSLYRLRRSQRTAE
jgi:lipoprotein signal peptidase